MTLIPISLATKSNPARYPQGGTSRLVNCFLEDIGEEGKTKFAIYASDGLQGFAATVGANGGVRAALAVGSYLYYVAGTALYRVNASGVVALVGSMNISQTAPVYMARNRRATPDVAVVCDGLMYYYRTTFQQVTDVDLLAPTSLAVVDGQFVIGTADNKWQVGDIDAADSWDGLSFERADASPDAVVRVAARQGEAVIFGEESVEFWQNVGGADGAGFSRSAVADIGCLAANSAAVVEQSLAWVASDRTVRLLDGYQGRRISTHAVERDIEALADRSQITAASWVKDGHTLYSITSPAWTWVYDTVTGLWHNRESYGRENWRISTVTAFAGKLIAGDADTGNLYEMSAEFGDEAGEPLVMSATLPPVTAFPSRITFHSVHIDAETGVGTGQGATQDVDPELVLSWSDDGGATFRHERRLKLGEQGRRNVRLSTFRLGQCRSAGRVFRVTCSARVARALYQMQADVEKDAA
jgi:hypothetical protein